MYGERERERVILQNVMLDMKNKKNINVVGGGDLNGFQKSWVLPVLGRLDHHLG